MIFRSSMTIVALILSSILTKSTSKYEGVSWNEERKRWQVEFDFHGKTSKYFFENEFDAIKTRDRSYKKMGILPQEPESCEIPNQKNREHNKSKYKGVSWHKNSGNWVTMLYLKGQKQKYGGMFKNDLDAAKKVNQLCEEFGIPIKNSEITGAPKDQLKLYKKENTSQYKGVYWCQKSRTWHVAVRSKEGKLKFGGSFSEELDAARQVNQLCMEFEIPEKNSGIGKIPHQKWKVREKTSKYKGVSWNKEHGKWYVFLLSPKNGTTLYGGSFNDELDAAKTANQLCEELRIPEKNPGIGTIPHQPWQAKEKTSQYKGVSWHQKRKKWCVLIHPKGQKHKYGGSFSHELDAAIRVNKLCEELKIPEKNPGIGTIPHLSWKAKEKTSKYKGVSWNTKHRKWYVWLRTKDGNKTFGGSFSDEIDAAKKINQLCVEFGIPEKNPGIEKTPHQKWQRSENKTIGAEDANSRMSSEIVKTDGTEEKQRKSKKNKSSFEQYYFLDKMLK